MLQLAKCLRRGRWYSSGTRKLTVSFEERNQLLKQLAREAQYPVLKARHPNLPITRVKNIVEEYQQLKHTQLPETPEFEVRGRVKGLRQAGKGLLFLDIEESDSTIQIVLNEKKLNEPLSSAESIMHSLLRRGDAVSAVGRPWRTKAGELSLLSSASIQLLSPSLHPLPDKSASKVIRKHNRVAELKAFSEARQILRVREAVVRYIAQFLRSMDFLQVSTPHLSANAGGASANSFQTRTDDGRDLYLRVAPELWLKRLIIGGFDRVFEIGYSYRNEGVDSTHNPEFTTCEFYMTFATLDDLMRLTKDLLVYVASQVAAEFPEFADNATLIGGDADWKVLDFVPEIEKAIGGRKLVPQRAALQSLCQEYHIEFNDAIDDAAKLLDRLSARFLESQCVGPTFIINHPGIMAPLAKETSSGDVPTSRRFELMIGKREYVNAYEEENDPISQLAKLRAQNSDVPDRSFVDALEWGLPPTGGWGLGIDRLVMLLTSSERIGDTLSFGDLNQVQRL